MSDIDDLAKKLAGVDPDVEEMASAYEFETRDFVEGAPGDYFKDTRTGAMVSREKLVRNMRMNPVRALVTGFTQGGTLGGSDEAIGTAAAALPGVFPEGSTAGERYEFGREQTRAMNEAAREQNPWAYYGGMIPGAALSSLGLWRMAGVSPIGQTPLGTLGRGMGMGGTEGAVVGGLEGEGGPMERASNAAILGGLGTAMAGALVPGAWAAQKIGRGAADLVSGAVEAITGRGNKAKAGRAVASNLARSGRSIDDVRGDIALARAEGQPDFRMMDALGRSGQRRASGLVRSGGEGAEELAQFLERRAMDATDRMAQFTDEAFPISRTSEVAQRWTQGVPDATAIAPPRTSQQAGEMLDLARREANRPAYAAARADAGPVNLNDTVETIDGLLRKPMDIDGKPLAETSMGKCLIAVRRQLRDDKQQLIDFDQVLEIKQELGRMNERLRRSEGVIPAPLAKLYRSLDEALEASSPSYRAANDAARDMRRVAGALDEGADMTRPGNYRDTTKRFSEMTPDEQAAARGAYGQKLIDRMESNQADAPDVSRNIRGTKREAEARAMALDPDLLMRRTGRERDMYGTYERALTGSMTSDNLADIANLGPWSAALRAARSTISGRPGQAVPDVVAAISPMLKGETEATRTLIARAMMSADPEAALRKAAAATKMSQEARAGIAAMLRSMARQPVATR